MLQLQCLKTRAFLEDIGDGVHGVHVHDLYRYFAKLAANRGDLSARRVVWHDRQTTKLPTDLVKRPPGNCWSMWICPRCDNGRTCACWRSCEAFGSFVLLGCWGSDGWLTWCHRSCGISHQPNILAVIWRRSSPQRERVFRPFKVPRAFDKCHEANLALFSWLGVIIYCQS